MDLTEQEMVMYAGDMIIEYVLSKLGQRYHHFRIFS